MWVKCGGHKGSKLRVVLDVVLEIAEGVLDK